MHGIFMIVAPKFWTSWGKDVMVDTIVIGIVIVIHDNSNGNNRKNGNDDNSYDHRNRNNTVKAITPVIIPPSIHTYNHSPETMVL